MAPHAGFEGDLLQNDVVAMIPLFCFRDAAYLMSYSLGVKKEVTLRMTRGRRNNCLLSFYICQYAMSVRFLEDLIRDHLDMQVEPCGFYIGRHRLLKFTTSFRLFYCETT